MVSVKMFSTITRSNAFHQYLIPWGAWYGDIQLPITFPRAWDIRMVVATCTSALTTEAIAQALETPIGSLPLTEIIKDRTETVAIAVDDLTRPACLQPVVDSLLTLLEQEGMDRRQIRIIFGVGAHKPVDGTEIAQKLGRKAATSVDVFCHDARGDVAEVSLGGGKSVPINRIFMEADLKIVISTVTPHLYAGYSGGAKMILPGLAGLDAITHTHKSVLMGLSGKLRQIEGNRFRERIEAVAKTVGVDYSIQLVVNGNRQIAGVFAGDIISAHRASVQYAEKIYTTDFPRNLDVVILNAYPKDTELLQIENAFIAYRSASDLVKADGVVVLTSACSRGMGAHGIFEPGGALHRPPRPFGFLGDRHLMVYAPGATEAEFYSLFWEKYSFHRHWEGVIDELQRKYPHSCTVGIIPYASLQMARVGR